MQLRSLAFLILYTVVQLPWVIFFLWPFGAGIYLGWGFDGALGLWLLWWIPAVIILIKKDRWDWWLRILGWVNSLAEHRAMLHIERVGSPLLTTAFGIFWIVFALALFANVNVADLLGRLW